MKYYIKSNGKKYGPVEENKIAEHVKSGDFSGSDLISEDQQKWIPWQQHVTEKSLPAVKKPAEKAPGVPAAVKVGVPAPGQFRPAVPPPPPPAMPPGNPPMPGMNPRPPMPETIPLAQPGAPFGQQVVHPTPVAPPGAAGFRQPPPCTAAPRRSGNNGLVVVVIILLVLLVIGGGLVVYLQSEGVLDLLWDFDW